MGGNLTSNYFHIIFATKSRKPSITEDFQKKLYALFIEIAPKEKGEIHKIGGTDDHVHLLVSLNSTKALSLFIRAIKTSSAKWVNDNFPKARYFAWQSGYCSFSVSFSNINKVNKYIADQKEHHVKASFKEEIISFLKKHNVEFDSRYI